jgi:DNA-binding NarL/FixJ family response regulator
MQAYRIILADDHALFRKGIRQLIKEMPGVEVIAETNDGLELLKLLNEVKGDMVLLDISMPNLRGLEATHEIKALHPDLKVLILTMHKNKEYLYSAIAMGAEGYLLKEDSDVELFSAIETVRKGGIYVTRRLAGELIGDLSRTGKGKKKSPDEHLTTRETEILKLVAEGKANKDIAALLCISTRTVETHRANIMRKLNVNKTADLVRYALLSGVSELDS